MEERREGGNERGREYGCCHPSRRAGRKECREAGRGGWRKGGREGTSERGSMGAVILAGRQAARERLWVLSSLQAGREGGCMGAVILAGRQ